MTLLQHLAINAAAILAYMSIWFIVGRRLKRLDVADTAWGGGFVLIAIVGLILNPTNHMVLITCLVLIWGARLANHIWKRNHGKTQQDPRYTALSAQWKTNFWLRAYTTVFLLQGALVLLVGMSITTASAAPATSLGLLALLGVIVWVAGFITESAADHQLKKFVSTATNKGKILDTGLWRFSRHPNYFGEVVQWWGIWLIAAELPNALLGLIGPITITVLILFVSGIPLLERRYKDDAAYQLYARRTSMFIPLPPRT